MYHKGVQDKKDKRERKKKVKALTKAREEVPLELLNLIKDREKAWQATQVEIERLKAEEKA